MSSAGVKSSGVANSVGSEQIIVYIDEDEQCKKAPMALEKEVITEAEKSEEMVMKIHRFIDQTADNIDQSCRYDDCLANFLFGYF